MLNGHEIPGRLANVTAVPKRLYTEGDLALLLTHPTVAIVGSRKVSPYGREVTRRLAYELAQQGIVIVSGLAFGVDSIAHQAALDAGGLTIAVLPSPLESVYPASHRRLARQIVESGGALVTEYAEGTESFRGNFVARNRIIAGLGDVTLITEAALKSGSLHTARFALESGRDVLAVPGTITSATSEGTNNLIKAGAGVVTSSADVLRALGLEPALAVKPKGANTAEQLILDLIIGGEEDAAILQDKSQLSAEEFNQHLTMLEITGKIRPLGASRWTLGG